MTAARLLSLLGISCLLPVAACVADPGSPDGLVLIEGSSAVHMQPTRASDKVVEAAPPNSHLTNFGGPILPNIHISPIYWNAGVQFTSTLDPFYNDVPNSPLYGMLGQYGIGNGSSRPGVVASQSTRNIADSELRTEVLIEINLGTVPLPTDPNNYYPVHLAPNMQVTAPDGTHSCVFFCAYHGTFQARDVNGTVFNINYGVLPDLGGACAGGCGGDTILNNTTSVASHELIEATTDPAVGLATTIGFPLAWYDPGHGEIGDICGHQHGTTTGNGNTYVVQLEFSNAANDCVQN
jgi:hypothetical protein